MDSVEEASHVNELIGKYVVGIDVILDQKGKYQPENTLSDSYKGYTLSLIHI